jgi:hypothetical protein
MNRTPSKILPFPPGEFLVLSAASMIGSLLMASIAWAHMYAFKAAYGAVCGSGAGLLIHCPACYAAAALLALSLSSLALAQAARRKSIPVKA